MIEDARHAGMSLENQMEIKAADPREKGYNEWRLPFKERMSVGELSSLAPLS